MPIAGEDFTGNPNNNEDGSGNEDNDAGGGTDVVNFTFYSEKCFWLNIYKAVGAALGW